MTSTFELTPPEPDLLRYGAKCCRECFAHDWLREFVDRKSRESGKCEFCANEDVPLLEVGVVYPSFTTLLSMYELVSPDNTNYGADDAWDSGVRLDNLIQDEWMVFSDDLDCKGVTADLLEAIINAKHTDREWNFIPHDSDERRFDQDDLYTYRRMFWDWSRQDEWNEYLFAVRTKKAVNAGAVVSKERLDHAGGAKLEAGDYLYRARKGYELDSATGQRLPYTGHAIGAPPVSKALPGRANRKNQSVLYCADQLDTAVAETRPARGLLISVATLRVRRDLRILDLVKPPPPVNPFTLKITEEELAVNNVLLDEVELNRLLRRFCSELSIPLSRDDDSNEYAPSQALSDLVREHGFAGIRYGSAMQPEGTNIVLFDPNDAEVLDSKLVEISDTKVSFENVDG